MSPRDNVPKGCPPAAVESKLVATKLWATKAVAGPCAGRAMMLRGFPTSPCSGDMEPGVV